MSTVPHNTHVVHTCRDGAEFTSNVPGTGLLLLLLLFPSRPRNQSHNFGSNFKSWIGQAANSFKTRFDKPGEFIWPSWQSNNESNSWQFRGLGGPGCGGRYLLGGARPRQTTTGARRELGNALLWAESAPGTACRRLGRNGPEVVSGRSWSTFTSGWAVGSHARHQHINADLG